jgi:hypothetical protein
MEIIVNKVEPRAIKAYVRDPAGLPSVSLSMPIRPPQAIASRSFKTINKRSHMFIVFKL